MLSRMESLDFSHNSIMKIDADTFVGMEVGILNLAHNSLRKVPSQALKKLTKVTELVLDCNLELEVQILVVDSAGLALFLKQCLRKKPSVKQGQHHQN